MRAHRIAAGWSLAVLLMAGAAPWSGAATESGLLPASAFGRDPAMDNVRMSPDGKHLAWSDGQDDDPYVNVFDVASARIVNRVRVNGPLKLQSLVWADDATLLLEVRSTQPAANSTGQSYEFSRVLALQAASILQPALGRVGGLLEAKKIASMGRLAAYANKEAINAAFETPMSEALRLERRMFYGLFATEDQKEGMAAFIEKRPPNFKNR